MLTKGSQAWPLVAAGLCLQHSLSKCLQSWHKGQPTTNHFVVPTRCPQAQHKQWLTLNCIGAPFKMLQNQYTGDELQTIPDHHLNSSTNNSPEGQAQLAQSPAKEPPALWGHSPSHNLSVIVIASSHSQSACRSTPRSDMPTAIKDRLQHTTTQRTPLEQPAQVNRETVPHRTPNIHHSAKTRKCSRSNQCT